jgi:hypothetical protein
MHPFEDGGGSIGEEQTFADREDCGTLVGAKCDTKNYGPGKLENCRKKSVSTALVTTPAVVADEPQVVKR